MIDAILQGVLSIIIYLVNILLVPIDTIISLYIPSLHEAFNLLNNFIDLLIEYIGFVISYTGLTFTTISYIIIIYTFIYTVPLLVHGIKLSIKWYKALKG